MWKITVERAEEDKKRVMEACKLVEEEVGLLRLQLEVNEKGEERHTVLIC